MDFDIDEEQEKEERELESYRQDANQRLAELKRNFKSSSSPSSSSATLRLPNSAPGLGSSNNNNNLINFNQQQQTRQSSSVASSSNTPTTNYTSRIINRTPGTVVSPPNSIPSNSNVPFVPQKFIPPQRISQTSQNSQNSQKSNSSPSVGSGSSSFVTPVKSSMTSLNQSTPPIFIPPFNSSTPSTPSSVGSSNSASASPLIESISPQVAVTSNPVPPNSYVPFPTTATTIVANEVQKKNPIVKHIRDKVFKLHFTKDWTLTDYILGRQTTAFYLSLKFHMTKPKYILERIKNFHKTEICKRGTFTNRIILVNVDVHVDACGDSSIYLSNHQDSQGENGGTFKAPTYVSETALDEALIEVTRISMWADWTVICGFSDEECALYLETIRACETKGSSLIQGPNQSLASLQSSTNSLVTSTGGQGKRKGNRRWSRESSSNSNSKPVEVEKLSHTEEVHQLFAATLKNTLNKRDHITLLNHFGSLKEVIQTTSDELNDLPGFGKKKVKKLINLFQTPFIPGKEFPEPSSKKPTKKQSNIKLVKKSILPQENEIDDEDDIFIVDKETGKEEKVNCKLKVKKKQSEIGSFFSQKPKTEEEDSD
ncbi:predicted protein [Naegleria gruberi]|uniref:Predicted protein n=1 Tax=Naegleria gruberi TaxID=5762 RepID=D2W2Q9_NAEGR|nr:uncharacterized protein NAEGRDRAFT_54247 [Naegleria gruberi]EFC36688.1 predicted protein [Naegleria gruberi]|eukprot:XP_002669432.1 predicted protein [Naegleria gruberi strain NEG-M]